MKLLGKIRKIFFYGNALFNEVAHECDLIKLSGTVFIEWLHITNRLARSDNSG